MSKASYSKCASTSFRCMTYWGGLHLLRSRYMIVNSVKNTLDEWHTVKYLRFMPYSLILWLLSSDLLTLWGGLSFVYLYAVFRLSAYRVPSLNNFSSFCTNTVNKFFLLSATCEHLQRIWNSSPHANGHNGHNHVPRPDTSGRLDRKSLTSCIFLFPRCSQAPSEFQFKV